MQAPTRARITRKQIPSPGYSYAGSDYPCEFFIHKEDLQKILDSPIRVLRFSGTHGRWVETKSFMPVVDHLRRVINPQRPDFAVLVGERQNACEVSDEQYNAIKDGEFVPA